MQRMIGVIGGSGVYQIEGLEGASWVKVHSPWGAPSALVMGALTEVVNQLCNLLSNLLS